jgi:tRNA pseudouridine38-40 synthase
MPRYFLELAYKGTRYNGFQVQENANTIQAEIEYAFKTLQRQPVLLTGSSRTDTGVHALQNFFHFDYEQPLHPQFVYKMNAILPGDIVIRQVHTMHPEAHARFDAVSREYVYRIHRFKNPFLENVSFFFPYKLDMDVMSEGAAFIKEQTAFFAFSKTNTQVKNFNCMILKSKWLVDGEEFMYHIEANRFLRGMVRLVTGSLLKLGRHKLSMNQFKALFEHEVKAGYSVPAHGLFLKSVQYPENYFPAPGLPLRVF